VQCEADRAAVDVHGRRVELERRGGAGPRQVEREAERVDAAGLAERRRANVDVDAGEVAVPSRVVQVRLQLSERREGLTGELVLERLDERVREVETVGAGRREVRERDVLPELVEPVQAADAL
jgi:hypothetical protein